MPSTFTTVLNLEKQATGENVDTWGPLVNANWDILETLFVKPASTIYPAGFAPSNSPVFTSVVTPLITKSATDADDAYVWSFELTPSVTVANNIFELKVDYSNFGGAVTGVWSVFYGKATATGFNLALLSVQGSSTAFSGERVLFIGNCNTAPSVNPSGGGFLYVESGALKWRGSSGTVTTLAPA